MSKQQPASSALIPLSVMVHQVVVCEIGSQSTATLQVRNHLISSKKPDAQIRRHFWNFRTF